MRQPCLRRLLVDGRHVAKCEIADTYRSRLRGMINRGDFDGALLLVNCPSVHGVGMLSRLDVALLDQDLRVLRVCRLRPFGLVRPRSAARHTLEARSGAFAAWGLEPGSAVTLQVEP